MKKMEILLFGDSHLRQKSEPVTVFNKILHNKIDAMAHTLKKTPEGAALAAPQVGILQQIVVVNTPEGYYELINPEIVEQNGDQYENEGCLSYPGFFGKVHRFKEVTIQYQDRYGAPATLKAEGFMAKCFQHEIDHLHGILFIDRISGGFLTNSCTGAKISLEEARNGV